MNEPTRDRLLAAARACVRTDGARASSRAIAAAAGANLQAITYHFGSKDTLVAAALAEEVRTWVQPALDALGAPGDPATAMLAAVSSLSDAFEAARDRTPALLEAVLHATRTDGSEVARLWSDVRARLTEKITALRDAGAVPEWVDPAGMASLILAVSVGVTVAVAIEPAGPDHHCLAAQFSALLLSAQVRR
jgi:AcrR family transcriptional regulator